MAKTGVRIDFLADSDWDENSSANSMTRASAMLASFSVMSFNSLTLTPDSIPLKEWVTVMTAG